MRMMIACMACTTLLNPAAAWAAFDACEIFTLAEAQRVMETRLDGDEPRAKARRARTASACSYRGVKEGVPVEAHAHFRFASTDDDAQRAFEEARMNLQTKPFLMPGGGEAFWSARTGEMNVRKGRAWVTLSAGPDAIEQRDLEAARRLAEMIARKL